MPIGKFRMGLRIIPRWPGASHKKWQRARKACIAEGANPPQILAEIRRVGRIVYSCKKTRELTISGRILRA